MNMRDHILTALREQFNRWEELLAGLSEEQVTQPNLPDPWSVKDTLTHLWAWQQRSIARLEAARLNRAPEFPQWLPGLDPEAEDVTAKMNAWIYERYQDQTWSTIHRQWREGFLRFLQLGERIPEQELLDAGRYPWLEGHSLADVFLASYDHHQEHIEKLSAWLQAKMNQTQGG
jgi:hypothetical protein